MKAYLILLLFFLTGCTLAPFTEPYTAKTLGKGNSEWSYAAGSPGYVSATYQRGLNDRMDFGGIIEVQSIGLLLALQGKYSLSKPTEDSPFSLLYGAGFGSSTTFGYLGLIKSFRISPKYELAFNIRYNVYRWDISEDDEEDTGDFIQDLIDDTIDSFDDTYSYGSLDMSNTYWFNSRTGLTLSLTALSFLGDSASGTGFKAGLNLHVKH